MSASNESLLCFKFRAINKHLIESLVAPSLYFAKPSALNDPFDCQIDLRRLFTRAALSATEDKRDWLTKLIGNQEFFNNWERQFESLGVCSFSLDMWQTLLWSHYADEHRGVCIAYELPLSFFADPDLQLTAVGEVKYLSEPLTEWLLGVRVEVQMEDLISELALLYLKTKHPAWQYEKEVRIIRRESGLVKIAPEYIKQICFGLRTPQEDKELVVTLARNYCRCERFGHMNYDGSDFGFTMQRYERKV